MAAILLLVVAVVAGILLVRDRASSMPTSIDAVPMLTSEQARESADRIETAMEALGGKARTAAYGSGVTPTFLVIVYEEATEVGFDQEFRAFSLSFMGTSGVDLDPVSIVDETYAGVRYRCQSDVGETLSVCVMGGGRNYTGLVVIDSRGSEAAYELAKKVEEATADVTL